MRWTRALIVSAVCSTALVTGCGDSDAPTAAPVATPASVVAVQPATASLETETPMSSEGREKADVVAVATSGDAGAYTFEVTVGSPDTGCERYSDWWEVVSPDGELVYRRTILHSHVDEQPYTRTGGPARIQAGDRVIVRAHMNTTGYDGAAWAGTPAGGFESTELPADFAAELESVEPQPPPCAF